MITLSCRNAVYWNYSSLLKLQVFLQAAVRYLWISDMLICLFASSFDNFIVFFNVSTVSIACYSFKILVNYTHRERCRFAGDRAMMAFEIIFLASCHCGIYYLALL
jgi:hypothetical protein